MPNFTIAVVTVKHWLAVIKKRIFISRKNEKSIVDQFHDFYFNSHIIGEVWGKSTWLGVPILKCPLDAWIYQEIIYEVQPDVIIETGTAKGGSAFYLAAICDLIGKGSVITVDIAEDKARPQHKRIKYITGSSTSPEIVGKIKEIIRPAGRIMVILDSDHAKDHVLKELNIYSSFVTKGSYLIVEDTNVNGHPIFADFGPGPMEAVENFLKRHKEFIVDAKREKFYLTFNPKGYLLRV